MDVTFLESEMFYHPSNSSFQGETHNEELNWFKNIPLNTELLTTMDMDQTIEPPTSTIETPTLIIATLPHSTVPHDPTFENIPEVSSPLVTKHLIHMVISYLPYTIMENNQNATLWILRHKSKYPIANYVSTEKLSETFKGLF